MDRYLLLLRHAEAATPPAGKKDFDRELTDAGFTAALRLGRKFYQNSYQPDLFYSSTAIRAATTSQLVAEQIYFEREQINMQLQLYNVPLGSFMDFVQHIPDEYSNVLLVGHNPVLSYFTEMVTNQTGFMLPTGGYVKLKFEMDSWMMAVSETAVLVEQG